jgi:hypothetical protein
VTEDQPFGRHSRESGNPGRAKRYCPWAPASAGVTKKNWPISIVKILALLPLLALAACNEPPSLRPTTASDFIVISDFAVNEGVVTLDQSFGFSLHRGTPGVPTEQRAASIGRAVAFLVTDTITERLRALGYDAASTTNPAPQTGGRALLVSGVFRQIDEGDRRQVGEENSVVIVEVTIKAELPGRGVQPVQSFTVDSRRTSAGAPSGPNHRETGVNADAKRVGAEVARVIADVAKRNNWLPMAR